MRPTSSASCRRRNLTRFTISRRKAMCMSRLKRQNILPMQTASGLCVCSRPFEFSGWKSAQDFIKHRHQSCMGMFMSSLSARPRRSIRAHHMRRRSSTLTGSPSITERLTAFMLQTEFCSITRARFAERLFLGNLDAKRDWGHARDHVEGMWRIVQHPQPGDYVLATGETHSVREFVEKAFAQVDIRIVWKGSGVEEKGVDARS